MSILGKVFSNTRKPQGRIGKLMTKTMNGNSHARMADWGMAFLADIEAGSICDFGCGGGRNVGALLDRYQNATVRGYDYSEVSVATAREVNAAAIEAGRCEILQGDVSDISLPEESLDLATAFETVYFWPGLAHCFSEVAKTLKPGGHFLIVNEADGEDGSNKKWEKIIDMKTYTRKEIKDALTAAGFSDVGAFHHEKKPWIAVLAKKG